MSLTILWGFYELLFIFPKSLDEFLVLFKFVDEYRLSVSIEFCYFISDVLEFEINDYPKILFFLKVVRFKVLYLGAAKRLLPFYK